MAACAGAVTYRAVFYGDYGEGGDGGCGAVGGAWAGFIGGVRVGGGWGD